LTGPADEEPSPVPVGGPWPVVVPPRTVAAQSPESPASFSVVIAAYQAADTVASAVRSALTQSHPAIEVIVCDDGSTDGTAAVLEGLGSSIRVVRRPNGGESAAKNTAVAAARGDYVVVLDADDLFHPRRLEALAWLADQRPDLDILTTDAVLEADGVPVRRAYHAGWPFPAFDQRAAILDRNFVFGLCAVRRERWLAAGGFDEGLARAADWEFWQRLVLSGSGVGLVAEPLARYRLTSGTLSSDRIGLVHARLEVLARVAARRDLTLHERQVVAAARRRQRRELKLRLADAGLAEGGWSARTRAALVAVSPGFRARTRLGALRAVLAPARAARRRARRLGGTIEIGAGRRGAGQGPQDGDPTAPG
jgi:hypothetical protein